MGPEERLLRSRIRRQEHEYPDISRALDVEPVPAVVKPVETDLGELDAR